MLDRLPPLYALRAFEVAARTCSFTRAGAELALTQSAISRHIRTLEAQFGCRLFERHGPRLRLTDAGQRLAEQLGAGLALIEQACQPFRNASRHLRLKAPSTLTLRWLLGCIQRYAHGGSVQLASVWMDVDSVDFASEPYDCAVLLNTGVFPEGWEHVKLFEEWLIPVCAPEAAADGAWDVDLRIDVLERHAYTVELRMSYGLIDPQTGLHDPSANLRLYNDARQVEATHCYAGRRWQDVIGMFPPPEQILDHRLRMNTFLGKWLEYLGEQGHGVATLHPADTARDVA